VPSDMFVFSVCLAAALGTVGFALGYFLPHARTAALRVRVPSGPGNRRLILWVGIVFCALGTIAFARYRATPLASSYTIAHEEGKFTHTTAYIAYFGFHIWGVAVLWWASMRRKYPAIAAGGFYSLIVLYGGWRRGAVFSLPLVILALERLRGRLKTSTLVLLLLLAPLPMRLFTQLGKERTLVQDVWAGRRSLWESLRSAPALDWTYFESFEMLAFALHTVPRFEPYNWGLAYFDIPLETIPRVIWPQKRPLFKPIATGRGLPPEIAERFGPGAVYPTTAELYQQWGWVGIVLGYGLIGFMFRFAYEFAKTHRDAPYWQVLYVALLSRVFQLVAATHYGVLAALYFYILPVLICMLLDRTWRLSGQRSRAKAAPHSALPASAVAAVTGPR